MSARIIVCWLICCNSALAAPVQWNIDDLVLDSGHQLLGAFEYDADTGSYSNVDIQVIGAEEGYFISDLLYTGQYSEIDLSTFHPTGLQFEHLHDGRWKYSLDISFGANLTNNGGVVAIDAVEQAENSFLILDQRISLVSGTVSAIPLPAAAWMLGSALASLLVIRRRHVAP